MRCEQPSRSSLIGEAFVACREATTAAAVPNDGFNVQREGMASILTKGNDVFYNEAQVGSRKGQDVGCML